MRGLYMDSSWDFRPLRACLERDESQVRCKVMLRHIRRFRTSMIAWLGPSPPGVYVVKQLLRIGIRGPRRREKMRESIIEETISSRCDSRVCHCALGCFEQFLRQVLQASVWRSTWTIYRRIKS